jgi:hypothetical protein
MVAYSYFPPHSCRWQQDTGLAGLLALHIERGPQNISVVGQNRPKTLRYVSIPRESLPELHGLNAQDCYIAPSFLPVHCLYLPQTQVKFFRLSAWIRESGLNASEKVALGFALERAGPTCNLSRPYQSGRASSRFKDTWRLSTVWSHLIPLSTGFTYALPISICLSLPLLVHGGPT